VPILFRDVRALPPVPLRYIKIGGLPVVGGKREVVGVITETDMLVALIDALAARAGKLPVAVRRPRARRAAAKVALKPARRSRGR
jgi:CBS domain-containing protein